MAQLLENLIQEESSKYDRIDPVRHITKRATELGAAISSSLCEVGLKYIEMDRNQTP